MILAVELENRDRDKDYLKNALLQAWSEIMPVILHSLLSHFNIELSIHSSSSPEEGLIGQRIYRGHSCNNNNSEAQRAPRQGAIAVFEI
ncbi:hypothetical protein CDAR_24471 [Caerostris darwini]|uniref:Uncharacterized protein n=1 Tax=Caerostris darwini TaxID=1538125 RepID=A0AAV4QK88_9ARAC|nr:hypothetical protein CDAR_24471 [Caerostris darwini]